MGKYFFILYSLLLTSFVQAQMTVTECVNWALANNPGLKVTDCEALIVREDSHQAWSSFFPSLDFSGSYRRQSIVPELNLSPLSLPLGGQPVTLFPGGGFKLGMLDNYDFKLTISQPIFTGFRLTHRWKAANAMASSKSMELAKSRSELIYKVETAYGNVLKAQKYLQIAQTSREQVQAHLNDVENFLAQGLVKKDELLKAQVKLSESELSVIQAQNQVHLAFVVLENLLGKQLSSDMVLSPISSSETISPEIDSSLQLAMTERAELKTLFYTKQALESSIRIAKGSMLPSFMAFGTLGYGKPGLDFINKKWMDYWLLGISAEWNLWNWGKTRSQVQQAKLKTTAIMDTERQLRDAIALDVTQACLQLEEATKRWQLINVMEARTLESFRITENNYKQGQATQTDFFDAQSELTRARLQKAQAEIDIELAKANWKRAIGINHKEYRQ